MFLWNVCVFLILFSFSIDSVALSARSITVKIYKVSKRAKGHYVGTIIAKDTRKGLLLVPRLKGLSSGYHGFHLHVNPSCKNFAKAARAHWDPQKTEHHRGPYRSNGHRGDLPALYFNAAGVAQRAVLAPRLRVSDLKGHTFVIHQGGDNYTDYPPNGGGGARVACGVIY